MWFSHEGFFMYCLKWKGNSKNQMVSFGIKDDCEKLIFIGRCTGYSSSYELRLLDETDIEVV